MTGIIPSSFEVAFDAMARALGGRAALQDLLQVGPSALSNYRNRGHIPADKLAILQQAARAKGWHLDADTLQLSPHQAPVILLIITGGIAAYKALELARRLRDTGAVIRCVMTESAQQFITPLSVSALTEEKVYTSLFDLTDEQEMGHIRLAREADLVLVAPATANFIAKLAHGMADDLASTLCLASTAPLALAPAMNPAMWAHPATQANLEIITQRGAYLFGPDIGDTACGEVGAGRLLAPDQIAEKSMALLSSAMPAGADIGGAGLPPDLAKQDLAKQDQPVQDLSGRHIIVTSGPTYEPLDPVRFIGNRSSGRQGHAIAAACAARGARVTLVSGPVSVPDVEDVHTLSINTAEEMLAAVETALPADVFIACAAVADWRLAEPASEKLKKGPAGPPTLQFVENPDILSRIGHHQNRPQLVIGFAAETNNVMENATAKRLKKGCDWIFANQVDQADGSVFGAQDNEVSQITAEGITGWGRRSKTEIAQKMAEAIASHLHGNKYEAAE